MKFTQCSPWYRRPVLWSALLSAVLSAVTLAAGCQPTADTQNAATPSRDATTEAADPPAASSTASETPVDRSNQVLRHAVFFGFKESASEQDVAQVVDAFRQLPEKIDTITNFQWGVNNSPEGKDDGFTHCFLLTFADEAGRATYLPHPDHKAFGDVLGPHLDKVFVIDYWGEPYEPLEKELKHAVFFAFKKDADPQAIRAIEESFAALPDKLDVIKTFEWGTNNSPERHHHGFTHCFMVGFDSEAGRAEYLTHPAHEAFAAGLGPVLEKVRVLDFWAEK